ncbi:MAG: U32 family peptidase [Muribaculaceae bacterium]|nr:U32 family peptidase [Muribaculaceae bacterium]
MIKSRKIELLAPAKDATIGIEAIKHGADAVYIGANAFGARSQAGNDINDIKRLVDFAHQYEARIYCTVNTIVYDHELNDVERMIHKLYNAGVDAIIVQDMALLRLDLPPIALHASTQCDIRTPEKATFLEKMGFSQLVLARELSLDEIEEISNKVKVPLEGFCHGALCVSYSGRCQISQALRGRSANRGECAQFCRLSYDLEDENGNKLMKSKHLLSLRDFNTSDSLEQMIDAGISSFKIEGRLKDVDYVKNVVAYYKNALDQIIISRDDLARSSFGTSTLSFAPVLEKSFNRSFTHYYINGRHPNNGTSMASIHTPKSQGEYLGKVVSVKGNTLTLDSTTPLANGDGLSYIDSDGNYDGFRVNKVIGNQILIKDSCSIQSGDRVYRTFDKAFNDILSKPSAYRRIDIDLTMWSIGRQLCLKASDERGSSVVHSITLNEELEVALKPQKERQKQVLSKLGDTIFTVHSCEIKGDYFIPVSIIAQLRRETIDLLERSHRMAYQRELRKPETRNTIFPYKTLESADNVANHIAEQFYKEHGVDSFVPAIECDEMPTLENHPVMTTRYCLRRELGACLKEKNTKQKLPSPLFLRNGKTLLQVNCNCSRCEMTITIAQKGR